MRFNIGRFILLVLGILAINYVITTFLSALGATGIVILIVVCIVMAFFFTMLNYPRGYRKHALKDPNFHRAFVSEAIFLIVLNLIFNYLF